MKTPTPLDDDDIQLSRVSEDRLFDELTKQKLTLFLNYLWSSMNMWCALNDSFTLLLYQQVSAVRKLCRSYIILYKMQILSPRALGLIITRLRDKMKSRQTYDKVFQGIWGASGRITVSYIISDYSINFYIVKTSYKLLNLLFQLDGL